MVQDKDSKREASPEDQRVDAAAEEESSAEVNPEDQKKADVPAEAAEAADAEDKVVLL